MIPVLEIGGTHASAALVDPVAGSVGAVTRLPLDGAASAEELIGSFVAAASAVAAPDGAAWGVAMPDPFDYVGGVAQFAGVGKFGSLHGVDVGAALRAALDADVAFLNDADAFVLGEWAVGAARGYVRCVGLTLGTGIGSGWLVGGAVADPGDPAGGRIHTVHVDGVPLEDVVSRRAVRRAFAAAGGDPDADVREITALARSGDAVALDVVERAYTVLGAVVGPRVGAFGADVLVVGGSIAASWDVLEGPFRRGAGASLGTGSGPLPIEVVVDSDRSALVGAAVLAARR